MRWCRAGVGRRRRARCVPNLRRTNDASIRLTPREHPSRSGGFIWRWVKWDRQHAGSIARGNWRRRPRRCPPSSVHVRVRVLARAGPNSRAGSGPACPVRRCEIDWRGAAMVGRGGVGRRRSGAQRAIAAKRAWPRSDRKPIRIRRSRSSCRSRAVSSGRAAPAKSCCRRARRCRLCPRATRCQWLFLMRRSTGMTRWRL